VLKVVVDTSVFVAGMLTKNQASSPAQLISMWKNGAFTLVMSPQILREIVAKLIDKDIDHAAIFDLVRSIARLALQIEGIYESTKLDKIDPKDNMFLAAAYEAGADYLISYDAHLLHLKHFHKTQILLPHLLMRHLIENK